MGNAPRILPEGYYALRFQILERDNWTCQYCGQYAPNVRLEIDHKVPIVNGGSDNADNLVTACWACNRGKEGLRVRKQVKEGQNKTQQVMLEPTKIDQVYSMIAEQAGITAKEIAIAIGISQGHASRILTKLKDRQFVEKMGIKKYGWRVVQ